MNYVEDDDNMFRQVISFAPFILSPGLLMHEGTLYDLRYNQPS